MKPKEFFRRWGEGIKAITPLQQTKITLMGVSIVLVGILIGIVTMIITKMWWLLIVLCGSLIIISISFLGNVQKFLALLKIDRQIKQTMEVYQHE